MDNVTKEQPAVYYDSFLFNLVLLSSQVSLCLHVKGDVVRGVEAHRRVTGEILLFVYIF